MTAKKLKTASVTVLWAAVAAAVAHFVWVAAIGASIDFGSVFLNIVSYGVPVLVFVLAARLFGCEKSAAGMADAVFFALGASVYFAMALHVTIAGAVGDMLSEYLNVPVCYLPFIAAIGLVWLFVRIRPAADAGMVHKVLYALPVVSLAAMVIHCGALCIAELVRDGSVSSAPWWTMPLLCGLCYLVAALVLSGVYVLHAKLCARKPRAS